MHKKTSKLLKFKGFCGPDGTSIYLINNDIQCIKVNDFGCQADSWGYSGCVGLMVKIQLRFEIMRRITLLFSVIYAEFNLNERRLVITFTANNAENVYL